MKFYILALSFAACFVSAVPTGDHKHKCCAAKPSTAKQIAKNLFINGLLLGSAATSHASKLNDGQFASGEASVVKASSFAPLSIDQNQAYLRKALNDPVAIQRAKEYAESAVKERFSNRKLLHSRVPGGMTAPFEQEMEKDSFDWSDMTVVVTLDDVRSVAKAALEDPREFMKTMAEQDACCLSTEGARCCSHDKEGDGKCVCCIGDAGISECGGCCADYAVWSCKNCHGEGACAHKCGEWNWTCWWSGCCVKCKCVC